MQNYSSPELRWPWVSQLRPRHLRKPWPVPMDIIIPMATAASLHRRDMAKCMALRAITRPHSMIPLVWPSASVAAGVTTEAIAAAMAAAVATLEPSVGAVAMQGAAMVVEAMVVEATTSQNGTAMDVRR